MKHSKVKQHIIETASSLFYRNGYNSTGVNEIIKESGIAKATLYNHFKSKEDICLAYLQFKNISFLDDLSTFCATKPKGIKRVLGIFDYLQRFFKDQDFNGCWCIKTVAEIPKDDVNIRSEIQSQKNQLVKFISELLEQNVSAISSNDNVSFARQIYLLYESAVGESHLHKADWPIKEAKNLCLKILS